MPGFNPQEDDDKFAFQEWKKKWNKDYATPDEEKTRFENFKENLRAELVNPPLEEPLWKVLNEYADRTIKEHFGYIRLDCDLLDDDSEDDTDANYLVYFPVKQEDGTIRCQVFYPPSIHCDLRKFVQEEIQRQRDEKEDTKEEDQDATVKHHSTVPPVKRSSDDKDDTKEEDQDGGGQKQGCCSDCGK